LADPDKATRETREDVRTLASCGRSLGSLLGVVDVEG